MAATSLTAVLDACVKATLLLGLAALAVRGLRRASAASRHLVWTLGLAGTLALPLLGLFVPAWELPLLPDSWRPTSAVSAPREAPAGRTARASESERSAAASASIEPQRATPAAAPARETGRRAPLGREAAFLLAWLAGALLVVLPLGIGSARLWWMARRATRASSSWSNLARETASSLGLRRPVALIRGERQTMPMAWRLLRAAILLPEDAEDWPHERRRSVLIHELAHVKRRDCLTQALAHLACAVYWFHPLAWLAAQRMRAERERACDDLVLRAGAAGPDYADHLLQMARDLRAAHHPALATVAMARPSQLEGRLLAILDPSLERGAPSRARLFASVALAAGMLVPLAGLQPWSSPVAAAAPPLVVSSDEPAARDVEAPADAPDFPDAAAEPEAPGSSAPEQQVEPQQNQRAIEALSEALRDSDSEVRREAVFALGQLHAASAAPAIAGALVDADHEVRTQAAFALGQLRAPDAVPALAKALAADKEAEVRTQAAFALGQIRAESAVEALAKALASDGNGEVRTQAAFALGQIRSRAAVSALGAAIADAEAEVRRQAVFALGQLREASAVESLAKALRDADGEVREQAAFALGQIRDERAVDALAAALEDKEPDVRKQAVFALGQIRAPEAIGGLGRALKDAQPDVREQAAFALGQIRSREALPALIEALKDAHADVRKQAAFALGQVRDERAVTALTAALKDADAEVRRQAAFALGQVTR